MADRFTWYDSFTCAGMKLQSLEDKVSYYEGIMKYVQTGEVPMLTPIAEIMFTLARPNVDASIASVEAGIKSGKIRKNKNVQHEGVHEPFHEQLQIQHEVVHEQIEIKIESEIESEREKETPFFSTTALQEHNSGGVPEQATGRAVSRSPPNMRGQTYRPGAVDFAGWFERVRVRWNTSFPDEPFNRSADALTYTQREDLIGVYKTYSAEHCIAAVDRYNRIRGSPEQFDPQGCVYPSGLLGFLKSGVDVYSTDAVFVRFTTTARQETEQARMERILREAW